MGAAYVLGVSTTRFGRLPERTHKELTGEVVRAAMADAGLDLAPASCVYFGSCAMHAWGQANLGGPFCIEPLVTEGLLPRATPVVTVEGGCATGSLAFHSAWTSVLSGESELSLAVGVEKTFFPGDPVKTSSLFSPMLDQLDPEVWREHYRSAAEEAGLEFAPRKSRLVLLDVYALAAQVHMKRYGTTIEQIAAVAAKNHSNGAKNPHAHDRKGHTADEIMIDRELIAPLTRTMCAPSSDGAAAVFVCSEAFLQELPAVAKERAVPILASELGSGAYRQLHSAHAVTPLAAKAYAKAGVSADDIDVAEVHDATAFAEIALIEALGFCSVGEGGEFSAIGATGIGGEVSVNPSGGLLARGHPIAASGLAMLAELALQLRGEAGERQAPDAKLGLAQNGGGLTGFDEAACAVTILGSRPAGT